MWSRRSAILCFMVASLVALSTIGDRTSTLPTQRDPIAVARKIDKHVCSKAPVRSSLSMQSPWRSRPKSVLDDTDPRILEESDLGPVSTPSQKILLGQGGLKTSLRFHHLQLRC